MNLDIVLLLATAGLLLFGYVVVSRLDQILGNAPVRQIDAGHADVVIFCAGAEAVPLTDRLSRQGITFRLCPTPAPTADTLFSYAVALSDSDMDNLLFCRAARDACASIRLMARCNNQIYRDLFVENGVCALFPTKWTPETILHAMEGQRK